jgi:peptide/nickel transport system substrate-binding protein/oligopeptide transport system substrate-binding protein
MRRAGVAAASALVLALGACSGGTGGGSAKQGAAAGEKTFSVGVTSFFLAHFLPGKSGSTNIDYAVWTPLTRVDTKTGQVENAVAESIESADKKTWTIKIKKGWTFHNGEPVTAQSFADSWNATAYGPNAMTDNYLLADFAGYADLNPADGKPKATTLSGVKVVDDSTLRVTLTKPLSLLPYILAQTTFAPMAKAALADLRKADTLPIGDGPFKVAGQGMTAGATKITLERYDAYPGARPAARRVEVKSYQDEASAYRDFQAGTIDVTLVNGSQLATASSRYADRLVKVTYPAVIYLGFPLWDKRFRDVRVREAFSAAIDRDAIVRSLLRGFGEPARGLGGTNLSGGGTDDCSFCVFDAARAKSLLAEAGGWSGPVKLWTYQDATNSVILEAIGNQLRTNLGISSVTTQSQPVDQIYPNLAAHKIDGPVLLYMGAGYPHLYALADALFSKGSATNVTGFDSKEFTTLLDKAASAAPDQAITLTRQASKFALGALPLTPLFRPQGGLVYSTRIGDVTPEFLGGVSLAQVTVK